MSTARPRILHVAETIKGGIATFMNTFEMVCGDMLDNRYVVPDAHAPDLCGQAGRVTFARARRGPQATRALAQEALRTARDWQPDVLWFHSALSMPAMALLRARGVPGKYIYAAHSWSTPRETGARRAVLAGIERQMTRLPDLVVNISSNDRVLAEASGYHGHHIVIENALPDVPPLCGAGLLEQTPGRINLLFVGRLDRQKGLDLLIPALRAARKANPALHLHVVGASVSRQIPLPKVSDADLTFHDWVPMDRVGAYYDAADLVVMPSRWEGLPMVLIEALRARRPAMVSEASGLPGLIEPGVSGLVLPLAPQPMTAALAALDREPLLAMRDPARTLYEARYGAPRFRAEVLAAIGDLLQAPARAMDHANGRQA